jgi:Leucine-rich repeat (LRR) protein
MRLTIAGLSFVLFLMAWLCACTSEIDRLAKEEVSVDSTEVIPQKWLGVPLKTSNNVYKKNQHHSHLDKIYKKINTILKYSYFRPLTPNRKTDNSLSGTFAYNYPTRLTTNNNVSGKSEPEAARFLNLSRKGLTAIPAEIATMKTLKDLQLSDNAISGLGMHLFFCNGLKKLDLSSNLISSIPPDISYLFNLEELILRDNRLSTLPGNFSELRNLKILDLSNMHRNLSRAYNNFETIPQSVCMLPRLEKLLMEKLPISHIPVNIVFLKNLKILSLNGCPRVNIFNAIRILAQLPELQVLDISFTGTVHLPNEIVNLKKLKVLIWQEEGGINKAEVARIQEIMPETKIYTGAEARPFLRGNSLNTILNGY